MATKLRRPISAPLGDGLFEARGLTSGVRLFSCTHQGIGSPEHAARIATKPRLFEFIQMLETRRVELGISRSAIARELGVTQPTISRLFSGHVQNIELRTMVRVAEVLDSDLEFVIRPRTRSGDSPRKAVPSGA